jgi:hypothetical protein
MMVEVILTVFFYCFLDFEVTQGFVLLRIPLCIVLLNYLFLKYAMQFVDEGPYEIGLQRFQEVTKPSDSRLRLISLFLGMAPVISLPVGNCSRSFSLHSDKFPDRCWQPSRSSCFARGSPAPVIN